MSNDTEKIESLKAELSAWHDSFGTTQLTHALAERERIKSENARLAAEKRDLLAPTIELLQETAQLEQASGWNLQPLKLQSEINRLRAACGEKEQK